MCSVRNSPHKRIRALRRPEIRSILSVTGWPGSEVHTSKKQWGDQREPLVTDDLRLLLVLSFEEFLLDQENAVGSLKRDLLIFSRLIFESSVCDGSPSLTAAPAAPETRPWLCASAASIISFSCRTSVPLRATVDLVNREACALSHVSSTQKVSPSLRMTARSITFCSSLMFPGQG